MIFCLIWSTSFFGMPKQLHYQQIKLKKTIKKIGGFTLLEVLIVLGIILILSCMTASTYQHYVRKAAKTNARILLLQTVAKLESYYSQYYTYIGAENALDIPALTEDKRYHIVLVELSKTGFLIKAIPQGSPLSDGDSGILSFDETGERVD